MRLLLVTLLALFLLGCENKPEATEAVDSVKHSYNTYEDQYDEKTLRLIGLTEHLDYLADQLVSIDEQLNDPVMKYKRDEYESLKWSKAIMMEQLNEVQKEIDYITAGPQIKSSKIKDEAVTKPKMSGSGVGIIFDQKTGDTVAIMYNENGHGSFWTCGDEVDIEINEHFTLEKRGIEDVDEQPIIKK